MAITTPNSPVTKLLELDMTGIPENQRERAKELVGDLVVEEIQAHLDRSQSPVEGGEFKAHKVDGERSILFDFGDMRDAIEWRDSGGSSIEVGIWEAGETEKAFGHNTDFRGHPYLDGQGNKREFIPEPDEDFKTSITRRIDNVLDEIRERGAERVTVGSLFEEIEIEVELPFSGQTRTRTLGSILGIG